MPCESFWWVVAAEIYTFYFCSYSSVTAQTRVTHLAGQMDLYSSFLASFIHTELSSEVTGLRHVSQRIDYMANQMRNDTPIYVYIFFFSQKNKFLINIKEEIWSVKSCKSFVMSRSNIQVGLGQVIWRLWSNSAEVIFRGCVDWLVNEDFQAEIYMRKWSRVNGKKDKSSWAWLRFHGEQSHVHFYCKPIHFWCLIRPCR